jgi:alpha-2-macroglobulin-like protein
MRIRKSIPFTLGAAFIVAAAAAAPAVVATGADPDREGAGGALPLAAPQQLYIMTDKPLYRPGETIWLRAWEVDTTLTAIAGTHGVTLQLVDPRGGVAIEKRVRVDNGDVHNDLALPADLAGGRYLVRITSDAGGSEERAVSISTYEVPRLKQTLEFPRRGYGPGDKVTATLKVLRSTGEPARGAKVSGIANVDGVEIARPTAVVSRSGVATLEFRLPAQLGAGDGLLTAVVVDGGAAESIQRRIPIETGVVALAFYPEGGDLVTGLASRVYFAAASPLGEPVDAKGRIVDDTGKDIVAFATSFRGRGTFSFTPEAGHRYTAIVDDPATGGAPVALPTPAASGCVMTVPTAAETTRADLSATVACTGERALTAVAYLRGREIGRATATAKPSATFAIPLASVGQGAIRLTVSDARAPLVERLVYRKLGSGISFTLTPDQDSYSPRAPVAITIQSVDAAGTPVAGADLAVAVADDAVLSLADDHQARILARLYLEPEMPGQTIADPNFYFSSDAKAPAALDLLLGTQGWRRFRTR